MALQELLILALQTVLLLVVPPVVIVSLAGTLMGAIQAATTVQDVASAYAVRLLATVLTLYLFFPLFSRSFMTLLEASLK